MENHQIKVPTSFWIIAVIALLWNLMGLAAFFSDVMMSAETLAALPEAQQELYNNNPSWLKVIYGIATIGGTLACIGLLMRKSWCVILFLVSLIAVLVQMGYSLAMTNVVEVMGSHVAVMSAMVILTSIFLYYYSNKSRAQGLLS